MTNPVENHVYNHLKPLMTGMALVASELPRRIATARPRAERVDVAPGKRWTKRPDRWMPSQRSTMNVPTWGWNREQWCFDFGFFAGFRCHNPIHPPPSRWPWLIQMCCVSSLKSQSPLIKNFRNGSEWPITWNVTNLRWWSALPQPPFGKSNRTKTT